MASAEQTKNDVVACDAGTASVITPASSTVEPVTEPSAVAGATILSAADAREVKREHTEAKEEKHDDPPAKRSKPNMPTESATRTPATNTSTPTTTAPQALPVVIDVCDGLSLPTNAAQRVEVKWELVSDHDGSKEHRWWGASLTALPPHAIEYHTLHDEEDEQEAVRAPVRVLDYDPYPAGGFHERDTGRVVLLNTHSLLDLASNTPMWWRTEGSRWEEGMDDATVVPPCRSEEAVRVVLDSVLKKALEHSGMGRKMLTMPAAQQCYMAERIVKAKEKLLDKLLASNVNHGVHEITPDLVKRCMEEIGTEGM